MGAEEHGFELGQTYRDRRGAYQVLRIDAARGTIDTEDEFGTTRTGEDAALKWRIWCNLPVIPARVEARRPAPPPPPVAPPETIESICVQRGMPSVVHFTLARNVPSILRHGLVPRAEHEALGSLDVEYVDSPRPDRHDDATSVSVGFPDWKLFRSLRDQDPAKPWAVLVLSPALLWTLNCAFYETNAGSESMRGIPPRDRKGLKPFRSLFDDTRWGLRMQAGIPPALPTDPRAEVLVFATIPASLCQSIDVESPPIPSELRSGLPSAAPVRIDNRYFIPRVDWKRAKRGNSVVDDGSNDETGSR